MAQILTVNEYINKALDSAYNRTAGKMLQQIEFLTKSPNSRLQRSLAKLREEAVRLEKEGKRMESNNPQLLQTMDDIEATFEAVASLIQANDNSIEASGQLIAVPGTTAKVFSAMSRKMIEQGIDPLSPNAMNFYMSNLKKANIAWREA